MDLSIPSVVVNKFPAPESEEFNELVNYIEGNAERFCILLNDVLTRKIIESDGVYAAIKFISIYGGTRVSIGYRRRKNPNVPNIVYDVVHSDKVEVISKGRVLSIVTRIATEDLVLILPLRRVALMMGYSERHVYDLLETKGPTRRLQQARRRRRGKNATDKMSAASPADDIVSFAGRQTE